MTDDEKNQLHKHKENVKPPTTVETKKDGNFPSGLTVGDIATNKPVTVIPDYSGLVPDLLKKTSSVPVERRSSVSSVNSDYSDQKDYSNTKRYKFQYKKMIFVVAGKLIW